MKAERLRRLQQLEARLSSKQDRQCFTVINDQAEVDRLEREHPDARIIHIVAVAPPPRQGRHQ